ncbi:MAG: SdpI family protein [Sphingomicrobium sp.]
MFVLIGNQLGKSRSMYLIGIRTPWTLASEEVWIKTHRLAGKLMVAGGLLLIVAAFLPLPPALVAAATVGIIAIAVGVPLVYSFLLWRRERHGDQSSG